MPRPPKLPESVQIAVRVPADWLKRADGLIAKVSSPGFCATRTDVLRMAMAKGMAALKEEFEWTHRVHSNPSRPPDLPSIERWFEKFRSADRVSLFLNGLSNLECLLSLTLGSEPSAVLTECRAVAVTYVETEQKICRFTIAPFRGDSPLAAYSFVLRPSRVEEATRLAQNRIKEAKQAYLEGGS